MSKAAEGELIHGGVHLREGRVVIDTVEERGRFIDDIDGTTVTLGPCSLEDHHSPTNPPLARMGDRITVEWPDEGGRFRLTEMNVHAPRC